MPTFNQGAYIREALDSIFSQNYPKTLKKGHFVNSLVITHEKLSKTTKIITVPKGRPESGYVNEEEMYNDEIRAFLQAVNKKIEYPHAFADSWQLLKTLYALEKSNRSGKKILL